MCENQYFHCFEPQSITTWVSETPVAVIMFLGMLPERNLSYLSPMCCNFWEKYINSHKIGQGAVPP